MSPTLLLLIYFAVVILCKGASCFIASPTVRSRIGHVTKDSALLLGPEQDDMATEALQSLVDFHEGRWRGRAKSWTVIPDTAAGVVQRKESPEYEISVKLGLNSNGEYSLTETFSWEDKIASRSLSLMDCNMDVDSVDATYSLDSTLPDFPAAISGTDQLCQFAIEHCIAASDNSRRRCFILYGVDQSLQRIVICDESRSTSIKERISTNESEGKVDTASNQLTARDLLEMQSDVDRLVDKLVGRMESSGASPPATPPSVSASLIDDLGKSTTSNEGSLGLSPHDISLLEISSGVWLGDSVIRNFSGSSPDARGFAKGKAPASTREKAFARWSIGVQKIAWRWMWNFGEEIRQVVDVGKAMGSQLADSISESVSGSVCVNESLSRRIPKTDRMVYVDWTGDMIGFLVGPVCIQAPRYLNFDQKPTSSKRFFTRFFLFQRPTILSDSTTPDGTMPDLYCSETSRVYKSNGELHQGMTSFYTFSGFGADEA